MTSAIFLFDKIFVQYMLNFTRDVKALFKAFSTWNIKLNKDFRSSSKKAKKIEVKSFNFFRRYLKYTNAF